MTMGPEPIRRIEWRSVRLGIYEVLQRLVNRDHGSPAGGLPELACVAHKVGDVRRPRERGIRPWRRRYAHDRGEPIEEVAEPEPHAAGHVVRIARDAPFEQEPVGL